MRTAVPLLLLALLVPATAAGRPRIAEFGMPLHTAPVAHTSSFGVRVRSAVLRPGRRFDLVGLRWRRGELVDARVRTRVGGRWLPWVPMPSAEDHGPDRPAATHSSDPVWAGGAEALQLSWRSAPRDMRLRFVRITDRVRIGPRAKAAQAAAPPAIVPRRQWDPGNQCAPRATPDYGQVHMAFVHHTVTANDYDPEETPAIVLAICRYHRNANGWNDVGYNFLVDKYGRLFEGRAGGIDRPVVGAQAQGWNSQSTSVSNIGDFTNVPESDAALHAMADLLSWKLGLHGVPVSGRVTLTSAGGSQNRYPSGQRASFERISGHRDGGRTACPGDALYDQLPTLRSLTAARADGTAPPPAAPTGSVSLQALSPVLVYPEPARLTGSISGGGEVWVQVAAGSAFRTVAKTQPAANGSWAVEVPLTRTHAFRAMQVLPGGRHGAKSSTVEVRLRPALAASARRRVLAGRALRVRGTIAPAQSWLTASTWIQGRDGRYRYVRKIRFRVRRGRFERRIVLGRPGLYRVRVRFAGTRFALAATAPDLYARAVRHRRSLTGGAAGPRR